MPPVLYSGSGSTGSTEPSAPGHDSKRRLNERAAKVRFRRAIALMVMTLFIPGSAQLVVGNKSVGRAAIRIWLTLIAVGLVTFAISFFSSGFAFWLVSNPTVLFAVRMLMIVAAAAWAALFIDAWRLGQPLTLQQKQRLTVVGVNAGLCFVVVTTLLFGAHLVNVQRDFMSAVFASNHVEGAKDGRFNLLLVGSDSGKTRWGMRPDSVTVASIDASTGRTALISLPRNLQNFHFAKGTPMDKEFPDGFDCEGCYLNGVSTWARDHTEMFGKDPGTEALIQAVEGVTDLEINYWAMVNLKGFTKLVDAVGGVKLKVRDRIPVGGLGDDVTGYIEPGTRVLNGHDTLWFARSREGSDDYSRMARQKCVMNAMLQQTSPQSVLANFGDIADAGKAMVDTNIPGSEVDMFMDLALKAKSQPITSVSIVPPQINTADPDESKIHAMIDEGIEKASGDGEDGDDAAKKTKPKVKPNSTVGGSLGNHDDGYVANQSENLAAAC